MSNEHITPEQKPIRVKVKLTKLEVQALLSAAGNGNAEGEYFCDHGGKDSGYGGMRMQNAYNRAVEKLEAGLIVIEYDSQSSEIERLRKENESDKAEIERLREALRKQHADTLSFYQNMFLHLYEPERQELRSMMAGVQSVLEPQK